MIMKNMQQTKNYRFVLQYDGTRYDGWQKQGNTDNTIQGKLEQVLTRMVDGMSVEVHGAGRTDAGVHAVGQVANAHLRTNLSESEMLSYMNRYLPEDIMVTEVKKVTDRFHSRLNASGKIYTYGLDMAPKSPVFQRKYIYTLGETLNLEAMRQAAGHLTGTHDFKSFCSNKHFKKSTVRTIDRVQILSHGSQLEIRVQGDGFLYNMVRILVGTLIEVGQGRRAPDDIPAILAAKDRERAGFTAPAKGLFLTEVLY